MYLILVMRFQKLNGGLSLRFLPFWNPQDVYFQVQALNSNHTQRKKRDQVILSNLLVLVRNCTVKSFSRINQLKHGLTMISLLGGGGFVHPLRFPSPA